MKDKIAVLNGPNLNLLGTRRPDVYGAETLDDILKALGERALSSGFAISAFQSNSEGELVDAIQKASRECAAIIINPAAYTHTSVAIRDALECCAVPVVEVHLSNIYQREDFRRHSYVSEIASGVISGFGAHGYSLALEAVIRILTDAAE